MSELTDELPGRTSLPFNRYWIAFGVSDFGNTISALLIPLLAATTLDASASQFALLVGSSMVPMVVLQIPFSILVDRHSLRMSFLALLDAVSGVVVLAIPIVWWLDRLSIGTLLALSVAKSIAAVFRSVASPAVVRDLVDDDELVAANGKLNATRSAMDVFGDSAAGGLAAVVALPVALVVDAATFVFSSVVSLSLRNEGVRSRERSTEVGVREQFASLVAIARPILVRQEVRLLVVIALANGLTEAVLLRYLSEDLGLPTSAIGLLVALGAIGGVAGGASVNRVFERFGVRTVWIGVALTAVSLLPLAAVEGGPLIYPAVVIFELAGSLGGTLAIASIFGSLQMQATDATVGRTMAFAENAIQVSALVGVVLGGIVAASISSRATLLVALFVIVLCTLGAIPKFRSTKSVAGGTLPGD